LHQLTAPLHEQHMTWLSPQNTLCALWTNYSRNFMVA